MLPEENTVTNEQQVRVDAIKAARPEVNFTVTVNSGKVFMNAPNFPVITIGKKAGIAVDLPSYPEDGVRTAFHAAIQADVLLARRNERLAKKAGAMIGKKYTGSSSNMPLQRPTLALVQQEGVDRFKGEPDSVASDAALTLLFKTFPHNRKIEEVLLKVAALNQIYRGGIRKKPDYDVDAIYAVAKLICELDTDPKLAQGSLDLVKEIADTEISGVYKRPVFATKYCFWHRPDNYPVRDSQASALLWKYQQQDGFAQGTQFAKFQKKDDLDDYPLYKCVIDEFVRYYGLGGISYWEFDKFLWRYKG